MFLFELLCQSSNPNQFEKTGTIQLHQPGINKKKRPLIVFAKTIATLFMVGIGFGLITPFLPFGLGYSIAITTFVLGIYVALSYLIRPRPNGDNMGYLGGAFDDPFQFRDDMNRTLFRLHCFLGPGRFASETMIDVLTVTGVMSEVDEHDLMQEEIEREDERRAKIEAEVIRRRQQSEHQGEQQLDSLRYLQQTAHHAD